MSDLVEIRWHARGGQGAVTASKLLAEAALEDGKHFQGMPDYGAERMSADPGLYQDQLGADQTLLPGYRTGCGSSARFHPYRYC